MTRKARRKLHREVRRYLEFYAIAEDRTGRIVIGTTSREVVAIDRT